MTAFKAREPVFDANIGVGECLDKPAYNAAELLEEMHRHGVERVPRPGPTQTSTLKLALRSASVHSKYLWHV